MGEKTDIEKLRILLPHWIEHNDSHRAEFSKWREAVAGAAPESALKNLAEAAAALEKAGRALESAMAELGGPLGGHHHHHHHHHD